MYQSNSLLFHKGGLISESFSLWLLPPKNVQNCYPELKILNLFESNPIYTYYTYLQGFCKPSCQIWPTFSKCFVQDSDLVHFGG